MTVVPRWMGGALARTAGAPPVLSRPMSRRQERHADRVIAAREIAADREYRLDVAHRFTAACLDAGFGMPVAPAAPGLAVPFRGGLPIVHQVEQYGPDGRPRLLIELRPGQTTAGLEDAGAELASAVGAWRLMFTRYDLTPLVEVTLLQEDPLAAVVPFLPPAPDGHIVLGVSEWGESVSTHVDDLTSIIAAGSTRSGKSGFAYGLIAQLVREGVLVVGVDPTGLMLDPLGLHTWRAIGTEVDAAARYAAAVEGVVGEMDRRIAILRTLRPRTDKMHASPEFPRIAVVVEEAGAVAKICGHKDAKPSALHQALSRVLAEGMKVGLFVITLVQRAEAGVVGSYERDQSLTRLTFAVNDPNTIKMLHNSVPDELLQGHGTVAKGVALLTAPGVPLARIRAPWVGGDSPDGYAQYCRLVGAT